MTVSDVQDAPNPQRHLGEYLHMIEARRAARPPTRRGFMQKVPKPAIRVLFVDDDRAARDGYTAYLSGCGYDVLTAATGHEALTLAVGWLPDVVVLDLSLPDIDGWEISRRLKASAQTGSVPIIALTGAALPHERVSAMRAGCDRYLTKPCDPPALVDAIERCISALN